MASNDESRYPIPIYFTDESVSTGETFAKKQYDRGGKTPHRGRRARQEPLKGSDNSNLTASLSRHGLETERGFRNDEEHGAGDEFQDNSTEVDRNRQLGRGPGPGRRGRGLGRGSQARHYRDTNKIGMETSTGRKRSNRRNSIDNDHANDNIDNPKSTVSADTRNVSGRSRGGKERSDTARGARRGRARLRSCQSETALNRLSTTELQVPVDYERRNYHKGQTAEKVNAGSKGDDNKKQDGSQRSNKNAKGPREFTLGYKKLEEWSKMTEDPDNLVLTIGNSKSGLVECLQRPLKPDWLHRVLEILAIAVKTQTCTYNLRNLLHNIEEMLLQKLNDFLSQVLVESETHRDFYKSKDRLKNICLLIISLLKYQMTVLPASLGKCYPVILLIKQVQNDHDLQDELLANEIQELELMKESIKEERDNLRQRTKKLPKNKRIDDVESEPPENFRELPILPSCEDLLNDTPFLRSNIDEGKYRDLDQYLDIQFRLLREDYIRPLRNGIRDYRFGLTSGLKVNKVREIRLYHSVQILMPVCTFSGICHVLQFDTEPFKRMNWSTSKRLLYGSLICLSADDFDTMIFGTVTDRNPKEIAHGLIQVMFEKSSEVEIKPNVSYLMAETTAYFEAYRHILYGLHEMHSMPLQRYIIHCEKTLKPPSYLLGRGVPMYDFSCVWSISAIRRGLRDFPVLNTNRWPKEDDLAFDTSQMDAMKMALSKELVLIQGPPGTGKTYVGLKIAKMLLHNRDQWNGKGSRSYPILVVCFTNHALDQFLEGIHTFCEADIVRVGGRSNNETLEPFLLKNIRKKNRKEKKRSIGLLKCERDCMQRMAINKREIETVSEKIKDSSSSLVPILTTDIISPSHLDSLRQRVSFQYKEKALGIWLGLTSEENEQESEMLDSLPVLERLNRIWKDLILNDIPPMTEHEAFMVTDIHLLTLYSRARLYKAWVTECTNTLQNELRSDSKDDTVLRKQRQAAIAYLKSNIAELGTLKTFKPSLEFITQMMALCDIPLTNPGIGHIRIWLCLDKTVESSALIKEVIENLPVETPENLDDEDLEEDRQLDDEDDDFLADYSPKGAKQIRQKVTSSDSEWVTILSERKMEKKVRHIMNKAPKISEEDVADIDDVWELTFAQRKELYRFWVRRYRASLKQKIARFEEQYADEVKKYKELTDLENIEIMRCASVIGMTTTGAAKHRTLLQKVKPQILIVEEAAEVLESHIITTLNENCQHLILIGDHKQLRPNPTVYELAKHYKLDISLFERMIKNEIPCVTLSEQHRMRPEISILMRHKNLYPNLKDHISVTLYGQIKGVDSSVYFIDHKEIEEQSNESTSYFNTYEAQFLASLCKYLLMQGYEPEQITVLSPYMGQVLTLRKAMPKGEFGGVRITAVDNFQGEENDIILLSLVRSCPEDAVFTKRNPIGFLGIENRVCVALSRAKMGFFVIGNFSHLAKNSEIWQFMVDTMRNKNKMKTSVALRCQNHPENIIEAAKPEDFKKAPEGGCKLNCEYPLKCNHMCRRFCHVIDKTHELYKCFKQCTKTNDCGHRCQKKCYQDCLPCLTKVEKTIPVCRHTAYMACSVDPIKWKCIMKCNERLVCGHECGLICGDCQLSKEHKKRCETETERIWPCGHVVKTECWKNPQLLPCPEPCKNELNCGHPCTGTCGECLGGKLHKSCTKTCKKILPCGHTCSFPCSEICPPCGKSCDWICSHGVRCKNKCSQECHNCAEDCAVRCRHMKCSQVCNAECENFKCDEPCGKFLECKHPCAGLCGEECPRLCPVCEPQRFSEPGEKVVFLKDCKCIISVSRLDFQMQETLQSDSFRVIPVFKCPDCKKPITTVIKRYINLMKKRRQLIIKRYLALTGTAMERKQEAVRLHKQLLNLRTKGLRQADAKLLEKNINEDSFGSLNNTRRKIELLEELFQLLNEATRLADKKGQYVSTQANKIKEILMMKRKYFTSQFWNEARQEIHSLREMLDDTEDIMPTSNQTGKPEKELSLPNETSTGKPSLKIASRRLLYVNETNSDDIQCSSDDIGEADSMEIQLASDDIGNEY